MLAHLVAGSHSDDVERLGGDDGRVHVSRKQNVAHHLVKHKRKLSMRWTSLDDVLIWDVRKLLFQLLASGTADVAQTIRKLVQASDNSVLTG